MHSDLFLNLDSLAFDDLDSLSDVDNSSREAMGDP